MLLSMTGFGEAREQSQNVVCRAELRSVNNRHFKLSLRWPDGFAHLESDLEKMLRETIARGSVSLTIRFEHLANTSSSRINLTILAGYWRQLEQVAQTLGTEPPRLESLLTLPQVMEDGRFDSETIEHLWPVVQRTVRAATVRMDEFRQREGASMAAELKVQSTRIAEQVDYIAGLAPQVIIEYRDKLLQRVSELLKDRDDHIGPSDVLREVALFVDRSDINEEIIRLRSHLTQFAKLLDDSTSQGRKLDFMCQELFREVNTIGSKANHVEISHAAVEAKASVERMREIVQNVE